MHSIRAKIMATVLAVSLCSLGILAVFSLASLRTLRANLVDMSSELGTTAGADSADAVERQVISSLSQMAGAKSGVADEKLGKQQNYVQMTADYLTGLYANADQYAPIVVDAPDPSRAGEFTAQMVLSESALEHVDALADEIGLVGNAASLFLTIPVHDSDIESSNFSTVSGINILIDTVSDRKPDTLDATTRDWYQAAVAADGLIWTDVFEDTMGRGLSISCAAPFYNGPGGEIMGVVGFGSLINTLSEDVIGNEIGETGYLMVVDETGQILLSPEEGEIREDLDFWQALMADESEDAQAIVAQALSGESGVYNLPARDGGNSELFFAYSPLEVVPWTVIAVQGADEVRAAAVASQNSINDMADRTVQEVNGALQRANVAIILVILAAVLAVVLFSFLVAGRITRPLRQLTEGVGKVSAGELDTQIHVSTRDEVGGLADAFNHMTGSLRQYISDLTAVTAEKERIGAELGVATQIQASMLPCIFPPFPEHEEFDIYATMEPAKEVGGDFYDFFLVDDRHLGIVVADVSGKGVPAALFMVIAKTLIKNHAQNGEGPAQVLSNVNNQLCESNEAGMFVTCWIGLLDIQTGRLTYANAGHNAPLLRQSGGFQYLHMDPGFVLAGLEGIQYSETTLQLRPGDMLYLYTDGVTEATDLSEELYGEERLKRVLDESAGLSLSELLAAVKADIGRFVGQAPQFDDITMLALRFRGLEGEAPKEEK